MARRATITFAAWPAPFSAAILIPSWRSSSRYRCVVKRFSCPECPWKTTRTPIRMLCPPKIRASRSPTSFILGAPHSSPSIQETRPPATLLAKTGICLRRSARPFLVPVGHFGSATFLLPYKGMGRRGRGAARFFFGHPIRRLRFRRVGTHVLH